VGTSGYSYKEWKGNFIPKSCPDPRDASFYADSSKTVESTILFTACQRRSAFAVGKSVPRFKFALKANQQITHIKRLRAAKTR